MSDKPELNQQPAHEEEEKEEQKDEEEDEEDEEGKFSQVILIDKTCIRFSLSHLTLLGCEWLTIPPSLSIPLYLSFWA